MLDFWEISLSLFFYYRSKNYDILKELKKCKDGQRLMDLFKFLEIIN